MDLKTLDKQSPLMNYKVGYLRQQKLTKSTMMGNNHPMFAEFLILLKMIPHN